MTQQAKQVSATAKKAWNQPQVRAVVPASHTRGGPQPKKPMEKVFGADIDRVTWIT